MGVIGCPNFYMQNFMFEQNNLYLSNVSSNFLYHGIDWVYTFTDTIYSYDFKVWYFWFMDSIYDNSFDFFFFMVLIF